VSTKCIYIIIAIFYFTLIRCITVVNSNHSDLKDYFGKSIDLLDTLPAYLPYIDSLIPLKNLNLKKFPYKLIIYINGDCFTCFQELIDWAILSDEFSKDKIPVSFLFYLHTTDFGIYKDYLKKYKIVDPVVLDIQDLFITKNSLKSNQVLNVILIDSEEKIKLIGNPLINNALRALYIETIKGKL
jgi:hypothetical protein